MTSLIPAWLHLLTVCLSATPTGGDSALARVRAEEAARVAVVRKIAPSVVCIFEKGSRSGGGSGVLIDDEGYGITNFHVVAPMMASRVGEGGLSDHRLRPLEVLGIDPTGDVAMFKLSDDSALSGAAMGDSDTLHVGDETLALGNPFLLAEDFTPTVTFGIVSGLHRYQKGSNKALVYTDCIQVDTSINPGNSGGPLFDLAGRVVGINGRVSIEERGRVNVGIGYAITMNQIKRFIPMLRAGLPTKHAAAGFTVADIRTRVTVDQILTDSPAYLAGLRTGDVVEVFDGQRMTSANRLISVLGTFPARWPVELTYRRGGKSTTISVRLGESPLPEIGGRREDGQGMDPYAPTPQTLRANHRAAVRALKKYVEAIGGETVVTQIQSLQIEEAGKASTDVANHPRPKSLEWNKSANDLKSLEATAIWSLLSPSEKRGDDEYRVTGVDLIRGRIACALERTIKDGPTLKLMFDDETGFLLACELSAGGKLARIEYDDYRQAGLIKAPFVRREFLDDMAQPERRFSKLEYIGAAQK